MQYLLLVHPLSYGYKCLEEGIYVIYSERFQRRFSTRTGMADENRSTNTNNSMREGKQDSSADI